MYQLTPMHEMEKWRSEMIGMAIYTAGRAVMWTRLLITLTTGSPRDVAYCAFMLLIYEDHWWDWIKSIWNNNKGSMNTRILDI